MVTADWRALSGFLEGSSGDPMIIVRSDRQWRDDHHDYLFREFTIIF